MVAFAARRSIKVQHLVPSLLLLLLPALYSHPAEAWKGGEAAAPVSGFQILHQTFQLDSEDPAMVESIVFDIVGETRPYRVRVSMRDDGTWFDCRLMSTSGPNRSSARCEIGGIPVDSLQDMRVVATSG